MFMFSYNENCLLKNKILWINTTTVANLTIFRFLRTRYINPSRKLIKIGNISDSSHFEYNHTKHNLPIFHLLIATTHLFHFISEFQNHVKISQHDLRNFNVEKRFLLCFRFKLLSLNLALQFVLNCSSFRYVRYITIVLHINYFVWFSEILNVHI